ncbi:MAG: efflux RND transporter periplasmic adaptor subunit [Burkholderiales bacterium]|nr:efflux RND transporter periplasmic adaptor subunit [Burkholderiales bacterium]
MRSHPTLPAARLAATFALIASVAAGPANAASALETAAVAIRDVGETYAAEGVVEAVRQSTIAAQTQGRIVELAIDVGDRVTRGQVIARIDPREATEVVATADAQVAQAEAALANTRVNYDRTRKLVSQKFVSEAALDKAQTDYDAARAQVAAARAAAAQARTGKGYTVIAAPFAGVVSARHVDLGEMAQPGKPLVTLFDPKDLRAVVTVPQAKLAAMRAPIAAQVELPTLGERVAAKEVTVLPAADARTHTTQVRLDLPEGLKGVYPGMFARGHFTLGEAKKLIVPASAVVRRSEVTGAYVVTPGGAIVFRQLRVGEAIPGVGVEVLAGLADGERVALDPVLALSRLKSGAAGSGQVAAN